MKKNITQIRQHFRLLLGIKHIMDNDFLEYYSVMMQGKINSLLLVNCQENGTET